MFSLYARSKFTVRGWVLCVPFSLQSSKVEFDDLLIDSFTLEMEISITSEVRIS